MQFGNNYNRPRGRDYNSNNGGNQGYTYNRGGNTNYNNQQPKKHSGCKTGTISKGEMQGETYVQGWNASKRFGMRTFLAVPYSKSKPVISEKSGRKWLNVMVKVSQQGTKDFIVGGMMDMATRKVYISELRIVMNPNAPNKGYCGTMFGK